MWSASSASGFGLNPERIHSGVVHSLREWILSAIRNPERIHSRSEWTTFRRELCMDFNLDRVRKNIEQSTTEDLLDRATVYRNGMESDALDLIDTELERRGITAADIAQHFARREQGVILLSDGTAQPCSHCDRPAVVRQWSWHRIWGKIPVFPRPYWHCEEHRPK